MADDDFEKKLKAAPGNFYYVAIDGTEALDSVTFSQLLETNTGWKNLAGQFLEKEPKKGLRLLDPAHPYLPICLFGRIAVVSPNGRNGLAIDDFWMHYQGELPSEAPDGTKDWTDLGDTYTTKGRLTAAENCADFMFRFMLQPAVEIVQEGDTLSRRFVDGAPAAGARVFAADLLFVSSHGWLGGYMRGNPALQAVGATPKETEAQFYTTRPYFVVGRAAKNGLSFRGPKWIILAQCSTVNSATWPLWASIFARSSPQVRGILAYEEASPDAGASQAISMKFFSLLRQNVPFLDAWKQANPIVKWAAIVHKDALGDTLPGWAALKPLSGTSLDPQDPSYLGFLTTGPLGEPIVDIPPPFGFKVEHDFKGNGWLEATPEVLDFGRAKLIANEAYRITITAPDGETIDMVSVRMVHIRPTYPKQIPLASLFNAPTVLDGAVTVATSGVADLIATASGAPGESCMIGLDSLDATALASSGAELSHAYFWFHVELTTPTGTQTHDFKTQGLSYG